jgi:hypothetical protein
LSQAQINTSYQEGVHMLWNSSVRADKTEERETTENIVFTLCIRLATAAELWRRESMVGRVVVSRGESLIAANALALDEIDTRFYVKSRGTSISR